MQIICKGMTSRFFPKDINFPADFNVTCMANHWSTESKAIQYLEKIVFPYVEKKKELNLSLDQKAMFIFDGFKGHFTEEVISITVLSSTTK